MPVTFHTEELRFQIRGIRRYRKWIEEVIRNEGKKAGDIAIIFCSNPYILEINSKYLNHNYFTDVITFDYVTENAVSGDIFVSIEQVRENSRNYSNSFYNELERVIIHGVFHLIGYDDKDRDQLKVMRKKEDGALALLREQA